MYLKDSLTNRFDDDAVWVLQYPLVEWRLWLRRKLLDFYSTEKYIQHASFAIWALDEYKALEKALSIFTHKD